LASLAVASAQFKLTISSIGLHHRQHHRQHHNLTGTIGRINHTREDGAREEAREDGAARGQGGTRGHGRIQGEEPGHGRGARAPSVALGLQEGTAETLGFYNTLVLSMH